MVVKNTPFTRLVGIYLSVIVLAVALIPLQQDVSAVGSGACDQSFYSQNDILFYDPCATSCSAGLGSNTATAISRLRGKNNGEKIFNFWIDAGLTTQQSAGVTASMYEEGNYSPFRQEMTKSWPDGGWGIAQFTHDPGQRGDAKAYVKKEVGEELFNDYYKNEYGGYVYESKGFIPDGVPKEVNEKFLLSQLNYLLEHVNELKPNNTRTTGLKNDFSIVISDNQTLFSFLKTIVDAKDATAVWTYLYEWPGNRIETTDKRAKMAADIVKLYGAGISSTCGGSLKAGGMTLEEAKQFMETYKNSSDSINYIGGAGTGCTGGALANCVSFSVYFINKYTSLKGMGKGTTPGDGRTVVANAISRNPNANNGHSPQPYAIFSTSNTNDSRGHTGVVLGVDTENKKVIIGEASCGSGMAGIIAKEVDLADFDNESYRYIYTDGFMKEEVM